MLINLHNGYSIKEDRWMVNRAVLLENIASTVCPTGSGLLFRGKLRAILPHMQVAKAKLPL